MRGSAVVARGASRHCGRRPLRRLGRRRAVNYVGEGQKGDQKFVQGNKSILRHGDDGRTLEGFLATGTEVTYLGEFELVDTYFRDAHETGGEGTIRQVIVFRLRALSDVPVDLRSRPSHFPTRSPSTWCPSKSSTPNVASSRRTGTRTRSSEPKPSSCTATGGICNGTATT
jgi:hypothetical protein